MLIEFNQLIELVVNKCLEKKEKRHVTFDQISDISGIPLSTTYAFLKKTSQNPSLITGGAICAALGVSLDAIFGIEDEEMSSEEISRVREEAKQNEAILHETIRAHAQNILLHEVSLENKDEIIRRQDLRMKELEKANASLRDRAEYQKKAIFWLRIFIAFLAVFAVLLAIAIILLIRSRLPVI